MSTMHNNTPATPDRRLGAFLKVTHVLLLIFLAGGLLLVVPASAQSTEAANTKTGSILGTVVDTSDDPVPDATVVLQGPAGDRLTVVTKDNGSFAFHHVTAGIAYQVTVTAEGFAEWSSSVTVEPGQEKTLTDIKLRILAVQRAVTVSYSVEGGCCPSSSKLKNSSAFYALYRILMWSTNLTPSLLPRG